MNIIKIEKIKKNFRNSSITSYLYILLKSNLKIKELSRNLKAYSILKKSKLFDEDYYLKRCPHLKESFISPMIYYMYYWFKEDENPSIGFDESYYLHKYPDVKKANINPLLHYILYGKVEERYPNKYEAILNSLPSKQKISIKVPSPNAKKTKWGDYHFAKSLKTSLEDMGYEVVIQPKEWYNKSDFDIDIVIVLRGLKKYFPKPQHYNIMWNISHPDIVATQEYDEYDLVFIASEKYAEKIKNKVNTSVYPLLQCTDPDVFYPKYSKEFENEILFVGNTRKVFRKIIQDILKTKHNFSVYGTGWKKFIPEKYIKKDFISNEKLFKAYSSCKILLNDHWEDMANNGFVSNRIFDGFASKAFIISDKVEGFEIFEDALVTYSNPNDLDEKIKHYLNNKTEKEEKAEKGYYIVIKNHTFKNRAEKMIEIVKKEIKLKT